ncbi:MAG TPA: sigma-70 family RNA polymerase sigma factor [Chloroflexota bacterium]
MSIEDIRTRDPDSNDIETNRAFSSRTDDIDLEEIYFQYIGPIYRFLYSRVGNREDAEDLAAETFLKASRQLDVRRSQASIASWLFTVARTVLADHWRRYYRRAATLSLDELDISPATAEATPTARQSETEHQVAGILAGLSERYRRVLELRFLRGFTVLETALEMGVTPENAKVLQHRALAKAVQFGVDSPSSSSVSSTMARLSSQDTAIPRHHLPHESESESDYEPRSCFPPGAAVEDLRPKTAAPSSSSCATL